jgi:hypothetical protein
MIFGYGLGYKSLRGHFAISYLFIITLVGGGAFSGGAISWAFWTGSWDVASFAAAALLGRSECELGAALITVAMGSKLPVYPVNH